MKKFRTTICLSEDIRRKLDSIYARRLLGQNKTEYNVIIAEAITLLYENEEIEHGELS